MIITGRQQLKLRHVLGLLVGAALLWNPHPAPAAILDAPWSGSGTGTTTVVSDGTTADPQFDYSVVTASSPSVGSWTFSTTAASARSVPIVWDSSGFYSYFQVKAGMVAFIQRSSVDVFTQSLYDDGPANCCDPPSGGFDKSGTITFADLQPGDVYGFRLTGSNSDGIKTLQGSLKLSEFDDTPPDISAQVTGPQGQNGFYIGPVAVAWNVLEPDSRFTATGCTPAGVTDDTAGTTFTCQATSRGGTTSKSVTIKKDSTPPDLTVPAGITQSASVATGRTMTFTPSATDAIDPAPAVTCSPGSGGRFPIGDTTVSCTAKDAAGNQTTKTFDVVLLTPPSLTSRAKAGKKKTLLKQLKLHNAPIGASVDVACIGRKCPKALKGKGLKLLNKGAVLDLGRLLKTPLPVGDKIVVTISSPTIVTTIETVTIRKGKAPQVGTTCLPAGASRPTTC
jgi:hypothetical protein